MTLKLLIKSLPNETIAINQIFTDQSININLTLHLSKESGYKNHTQKLMFIPVVLAILTRNKRRMSIPKQYVLGY